jgi:hypothetical protein
LVKDHSCNTFLYTIINTMALIISIADISKWTVPSVMSYVITLEKKHWEGVNVKVIVFNTTFNIILLISWQSILFVEENGVPGESCVQLLPYTFVLSTKVCTVVILIESTIPSKDIYPNFVPNYGSPNSDIDYNKSKFMHLHK